MWYLVLAVVASGVAAAVQAQWMGTLDRTLGTAESVFITYGGGGLLAGIIMLFLRGGNLRMISTVPTYTLLAGACGLVIVGGLGLSAHRLGIVVAVTILAASQFFVGGVIDHFGLWGADIRPLDLSRALGMACMLVGIWLMMR